MTIQIANEADCEELTEVEIQSKLESIPDCVDKIETDYTLRLYRWKTYFKGGTPKSSKPERLVLKAVLNSKIIGYIAGHLTTRYKLDAEIQSFYILKEHQRKGIGTSLLREFIAWAKAKKANSLCVGISSKNKYKAFYLKYGGQYLNPQWIFWSNLMVFRDSVTQ